MAASVFLDSNIFLYALGDEEPKRQHARDLLAATPTISTQALNECSHVLRRKADWPPARVAEELSLVIDLSHLVDVGLAEIRRAWSLSERYGFGHFDSLILSSALSAGCATLHTENLQHAQAIDGTLTVVNPFRVVCP